MGFFQRLFGKRQPVEPQMTRPESMLTGEPSAKEQNEQALGEERKSVYRSKRFNFSMNVPEGWEVLYENEREGEWIIPIAWASKEVSEGRAALLVQAREAPVLNRNKNLNVINLDSGGETKMPTSPQAYIELSKFSIPYEAIHFETESVTNIAEMEAAELIFSYSGNQERVKQMIVTIFGTSATYQFIVQSTSEKAFNKFSRIFREAINSFTLGSAPVVNKGETKSAKTDNHQEETSISLYNDAVTQFHQGRFYDAEKTFKKAYNKTGTTLPVKMVSTYARAIALGQLGKGPDIPQELQEKTDEMGCTYLAYTTSGYLTLDGHKAAISDNDTACADALIGGLKYRYAFSSFFGNFSILASRLEKDGAIRVWDLAAEPNARKEDIYANEIAQRVRSGSPPPSPIPLNGFPKTLD